MKSNYEIMNYLLDTCVISELTKKHPEKKVLQWLETQKEDSLYLSVLTLGEIQKGIHRLPDSKKKHALSLWVQHDLCQRFEGRILPLDQAVCQLWGKIQGEAETRGKTIPVIDSLIAATALAHQLFVVTRNSSDMEKSGVQMVDPWS